MERLVRRLLAFPDEVDDVVQEVFARAWEKAPRYRGEAPASVWLRGIAVRVARSTNRSPWRTRRRELHEEPHAGAGVAADHGELHGSLHRALARLPHAAREVLVLRYLEELEGEALAQALGVRRGALDMRLSRARRALRCLLEDAGSGAAPGDRTAGGELAGGEA